MHHTQAIYQVVVKIDHRFIEPTSANPSVTSDNELLESNSCSNPVTNHVTFRGRGLLVLRFGGGRDVGQRRSGGMRGKRDEGDARDVKQREWKFIGRSKGSLGQHLKMQRKGFSKETHKVNKGSHTKGGSIGTPEVPEGATPKGSGRATSCSEEGGEDERNFRENEEPLSLKLLFFKQLKLSL
ncbi:hypothetical protein L3X38_036632 [Prunus dulcis]|uniref:Uncharacterized protein n=1 Tax=Prunus dulcis TaxID=3755 RepID=A0AAD4V1T5_PRUDU|nr:hypothetical protein L3X38_036632 [Prunus dulcis]